MKHPGVNGGGGQGGGEERRRAGRPPATTRAEILATALRIIDRDGWEQLTVRRLAAEVGVGATTLYRHVRDKEDLFVQLLNEIADQALTPDLPADPAERIVTACVAIRDVFAARPWAITVLTTDGYLARLGGSAVRLVDAIVGAALAAGCTPEQAVLVFRNLVYFTVGEVLNRAHSARRPVDPDLLAPAAGHFGRVPAAEVPALAAIGVREWHAISSRDTFAEGARAFTAGLLARAGG